MFQCMVGRNGNEVEIRFPCVESDIRRVQRELEIPYPTDTRVKVLGVQSDIEQLEILENQTEDLDFLNLLGRIMYGMDVHEYEQFRIGLYHECCTELRAIIDISRSTNRYSIMNPNDLRQSGLDHELDIRGSIPKSEVESTDYSLIGKQLLDSGTCEKTPYGLLYVNEEIPIADYFDGVHMPAYYDRDFQFAVSLHNDTDKDFIFLPCSDEELLRAAHRLNTSFPYDLNITIEDTSLRNDALMNWAALATDIYELNSFARLIDRMDEDDTERYLMVLDYVDRYCGGVGELRNVVRIGQSLSAFSVYPNAMCDAEIGMTLLGEYDVPEELWEFFDAERFGEQFRNKESGQFTENGYIGINNREEIKNCLRQTEETDGMSMGGMA